jgi:hypothetical protein
MEAIKIANEEAARLAKATDHSGAQAREPEKKAKFLRVRVVEEEGEQGKLVEVEDEVDHKTVEVWVE